MPFGSSLLTQPWTPQRRSGFFLAAGICAVFLVTHVMRTHRPFASIVADTATYDRSSTERQRTLLSVSTDITDTDDYWGTTSSVHMRDDLSEVEKAVGILLLIALEGVAYLAGYVLHKHHFKYLQEAGTEICSSHSCSAADVRAMKGEKTKRGCNSSVTTESTDSSLLRSQCDPSRSHMNEAIADCRVAKTWRNLPFASRCCGLLFCPSIFLLFLRSNNVYRKFGRLYFQIRMVSRFVSNFTAEKEHLIIDALAKFFFFLLNANNDDCRTTNKTRDACDS
jgi:hypothetical protein